MGLILASASPRRQELLRLITEDFTVFPAAVDESLPPVLSVQKAAQYLARKKALAVANEYPNDIVLGSDTTVVLENAIFGKPKTPEHAAEMLRQLSGKTHTVITGVALAQGERVSSFQTETAVTFYPLTERTDTGVSCDRRTYGQSRQLRHSGIRCTAGAEHQRRFLQRNGLAGGRNCTGIAMLLQRKRCAVKSYKQNRKTIFMQRFHR